MDERLQGSTDMLERGRYLWPRELGRGCLARAL